MLQVTGLKVGLQDEGRGGKTENLEISREKME